MAAYINGRRNGGILGGYWLMAAWRKPQCLAAYQLAVA